MKSIQSVLIFLYIINLHHLKPISLLEENKINKNDEKTLSALQAKIELFKTVKENLIYLLNENKVNVTQFYHQNSVFINLQNLLKTIYSNTHINYDLLQTQLEQVNTYVQILYNGDSEFFRQFENCEKNTQICIDYYTNWIENLEMEINFYKTN
ncbi:hypothetical protein COBT_002517 [Conglomerata obtusa]